LNILIVKLSSLGDVVHAMPALADMHRALPDARVDWVVEKAFAPLVARCPGIARVIPAELRSWRHAPFARATRRAWRTFRGELRGTRYDAVIDLQGLTKSALVSRLAPLAPEGHRYALGNRTEGAGWEPTTRWLADRPIDIAPHIHAVQRSRTLCAAALGYAVSDSMSYGPLQRFPAGFPATKTIALLHGSSRADKEWPLACWHELGERLLRHGWDIALPHGNAAEEARSTELARGLAAGAAAAPARVQAWPRLALDALADRLAHCGGAIGVDSGPSHLAAALGLAHVQIYLHPTSWRTGPIGQAHQCSVEDPRTPSVDAVWAAWERVAAEKVDP
jgi:heptosyltransferase-1